MKLYKYFKVTFLVLVAVFGFACADLSLVPHQSVDEGTYLQAMADFRAAVLGAYDNLQHNAMFGRALYLVPNVMSDESKMSGSANRAADWADYTGNFPSNHQYERDIWREGYETIDMVNRMLASDYEAPSATAQTELNQILGEAYAIRATVYFHLARVYGQHYTYTADASHLCVPLVLVSDVTGKPARNTVAEIYAQVISDFNSAISMITQTRSDAKLLTKEACQALLSRVYLYMGDHANAKAMADAVINSGKYSLVDGANYRTISNPGSTSEAIFEVDYTPVDNIGSNHLGGMYRSSGYGDYLPSLDLLNLFHADDARLDIFIVDPELTGEFGSHRMDKWPDAANSSDNISVIRLAEVYLNRAEANYFLGDETAAQADVDMIRKRAHAEAADVTATGAALLEEILTERRKELSFEGHRLYDLTRHKRNLVRVDFSVGTTLTVTYPNDMFILPIPFNEMDVNPNMVQNPGW